MKLKSISVEYKKTNFKIDDMRFNENLTLLVGASGVGKTQVLKVIKNLSDISRGNGVCGMKWSVVFEQLGHIYVWNGEFDTSSVVDVDVSSAIENKMYKYCIQKERILDDNYILVERDTNRLIYNGKELVKLDSTKSVVDLLKAEPSIKPIYDGFNNCYSLDVSEALTRGTFWFPSMSELIDSFDWLIRLHFLSPLQKLYILFENEKEKFNFISQKFIEIFPTIEDVSVSLVEDKAKIYSIVLKIKETGCAQWITQSDISFGMLRTLFQITTLVLAKSGDIIMIDEFENGLGINCIDELADLIMEPDEDVQVIMTSHHPYIINTIPVNNWKILTRDSGNVHVYTAEQLNVGKQSKHDAFMQLIQTSEYRTGQTKL